MAATTRQAPTLGFLPSLNPVASPVDTYAPDTGLQDLARSLSDIHPALDNWVDQANKEDFAAGEAAYSKAKTKLKDAVDKGLIPAGASPAFKRGYQETALRVSGM